MKINQWLLSYKDPDLYPEKANDYDENWTGFRVQRLLMNLLRDLE